MSELERMKKVAICAAKEAGEILRSHFGKIKHVEQKIGAGIVTEADKKAEKKIISMVKTSFPHHAILAEESGIYEKKSASYKWIIDPLDGTTNFVHQLPLFCVSIGVEREGEIVLSVILNPLTQDIFTAEKGKGAFCNKKRISVSPCSKIEDALFITGFSYQSGMMVQEELLRLEPFLQKTRGIRRSGSAVWDFYQVAQGHFDGFWEKHLSPWDVAAGLLLVQEAGGKVSRYDGSPATAYDHEILASNGILHEKIVDLLMTKRSKL